MPKLLPKSKSRKKKQPKRVLALPDLEQAKAAVLNSLTSASGQRTYDHAIREFVAWYCSEPRLAFNRTVVLRYRIHLEQRGYASATINLRLAAVRRVAYEAADAGLLSPELAAGIRRVKGVRRIGVRLGNWLTAEQGRRLLDRPTPSTARELRDHAMVAMLIGCGLRRAELLALSIESIQQREEHQVGAARPATHLCPSLPPRGWRTGSDPVPTGTRLHPDDRALSRMQAKAPGCRERPLGNRTRYRLTWTRAGADASIRPGRLVGNNLAGAVPAERYRGIGRTTSVEDDP